MAGRLAAVVHELFGGSRQREAELRGPTSPEAVAANRWRASAARWSTLPR